MPDTKPYLQLDPQYDPLNYDTDTLSDKDWTGGSPGEGLFLANEERLYNVNDFNYNFNKIATESLMPPSELTWGRKISTKKISAGEKDEDDVEYGDWTRAVSLHGDIMEAEVEPVQRLSLQPAEIKGITSTTFYNEDKTQKEPYSIDKCALMWGGSTDYNVVFGAYGNSLDFVTKTETGILGYNSSGKPIYPGSINFFPKRYLSVCGGLGVFIGNGTVDGTNENITGVHEEIMGLFSSALSTRNPNLYALCGAGFGSEKYKTTFINGDVFGSGDTSTVSYVENGIRLYGRSKSFIMGNPYNSDRVSSTDYHGHFVVALGGQGQEVSDPCLQLEVPNPHGHMFSHWNSCGLRLTNKYMRELPHVKIAPVGVRLGTHISDEGTAVTARSQASINFEGDSADTQGESANGLGTTRIRRICNRCNEYCFDLESTGTYSIGDYVSASSPQHTGGYFRAKVRIDPEVQTVWPGGGSSPSYGWWKRVVKPQEDVDEWSRGNIYSVGDIVGYHDTYYEALVDINKAIMTESFPSTSEGQQYWEEANPYATWQKGVVYKKHDLVVHDGRCFKASMAMVSTDHNKPNYNSVDSVFWEHRSAISSGPGDNLTPDYYPQKLTFNTTVLEYYKNDIRWEKPSFTVFDGRIPAAPWIEGREYKVGDVVATPPSSQYPNGGGTAAMCMQDHTASDDNKPNPFESPYQPNSYWERPENSAKFSGYAKRRLRIKAMRPSNSVSATAWGTDKVYFKLEFWAGTTYESVFKQILFPQAWNSTSNTTTEAYVFATDYYINTRLSLTYYADAAYDDKTAFLVYFEDEDLDMESITFIPSSSGVDGLSEENQKKMIGWKTFGTANSNYYKVTQGSNGVAVSSVNLTSSQWHTLQNWEETTFGAEMFVGAPEIHTPFGTTCLVCQRMGNDGRGCKGSS